MRVRTKLRAIEKVHICFVQYWSFIMTAMAAIKSLSLLHFSRIEKRKESNMKLLATITTTKDENSKYN